MFINGIRPNKGAIGVSGTQILNGVINGEEYLPELTRTQAFIVYDKMRRGDGTVKNIIDAITLPIIQANWSLDYGSDKKVGEAINRELFKRDIQFKSVLREMIRVGLPMGFSLFEMVLAKRADMIGVAALESRKPKTIYAWETTDHKPGVTQVVVSEKFSIPRDKLLIFTHDQEGDNYEGISILRGAYKHWIYKDSYYLMDAVKSERQSNGIPYAKGDYTPQEKAEVEELLRAIRANEQSFLILPSSTEEVGFLDMKANTTVDLYPGINHHDRQIAKSMQLQFIDIGGSGSSGSFAASNDQKDLYYLALEAIADNVSATFQKLIDRLVAINFSNVDENPRLVHSHVSSQDIEKLANAFDKFVGAGVITPDVEIERAVRGIAKMPEMSKAVEKAHEARLNQEENDVAGTKKKDAEADDTEAQKEDMRAEALKKAHEAKQRLIDVVV